MPRTEDGTALPAATAAAVLMEGVPDGIVISDRTGRVLFVNRSAEELTGYSRDSLLGRTIETLVPPRHRSAHEGHRAAFVERHQSRPMGAELDITLRRRDGSLLPVDIALRSIETDGEIRVVAAIRDATERREHERHLREQAELVELAHDTIVVRRAADSVITFWNQAAVEAYGFSQAEALGQVSHVLLRTEFPGLREEIERQVQAHGRWEGELRHLRKDGGTIEMSSRWVVVPGEHGAPASVLEVNRDVTAERVAHERLAVIEDRERLAREIHDGAIQALFAVGMRLQATAVRSADATVRERVEGAVEQLDRVVHDLRGYVFGLGSGATHRGGLAEGLRTLATEIGEQHGMTVAMDVDPEVAKLLEAFAGDIVQIVREALSNAGRHGQAKTSRVLLCREDGRAVLEIDDDGKGFDVARPARRGQGLANFRRRAEKLGGEADVTSTPGEGTLVRLSLPL